MENVVNFTKVKFISITKFFLKKQYRWEAIHLSNVETQINTCNLFDKPITLQITRQKLYDQGQFPIGIKYSRKCLNAEQREECYRCDKNRSNRHLSQIGRL